MRDRASRIGRSLAGRWALALVAVAVTLGAVPGGSLPFGSVLGLELAGAGQALAQQGQDSLRRVEPESPVGGTVPGAALGSDSDSEMWRAVRGGIPGTVSIPDPQASQLIQSEGDNWRAIRNGPVTVLGGTLILVFIAVTALFFVVRGRIRIDAGLSGITMERFNSLERAVHWMTAVSFLILALTGLNKLYGRHVLIPLMGKDIFADISMAGKYAHNFLAFPFMVGLALMMLLWLRHNIPNRHDVKWIAMAGGLFVKNVHPPSRKFNAGQKGIFWIVVLTGLSLSLTGWSLLFPYTTTFFADTFAVLNVIGFNLPTELTSVQEMQLSQVWHGVVGMIAIAVMVGHIYIGSIGMEGAFAAMGSGQVDENWAREHHNLWVEEVKGEPAQGHGSTQPAE